MIVVFAEHRNVSLAMILHDSLAKSALRSALLGEWRFFLASITNHHGVFHAIRRLDRITLVLVPLLLVPLLLVLLVSRIQVASWKMMPSV